MMASRNQVSRLAAPLLLWAISLPVPTSAQSTPAPAAAPAPVAVPAAPHAARTPLPAPPPSAPGALQAPPAPPRAPRAPRLAGGYLGVELVDLTPELREHFGVGREAGVMVGRVEPGSPAARAGVAVADIVTRVGDEPIHDSWSFASEVSSRDSGEALTLTVVRDGKERQIAATLDRRERDAVDVGRWIFPPTPAVPGVPPVAAAPGAPPVPAFPPVGPALERLGRLLESDDFQDQMRAYQMRIDTEVEKRMRELEVRLKELEQRLQDGDRRR